MMSFFTTVAAHPIIVLFLLANLAIGFWAHTKAKANSFEDYALASRSLPTGVLVMTLLGTLVSVGTINNPTHFFNYGILESLSRLFCIIIFLLIGIFIAPHLVYFEGYITMGDLMNSFYGRGAHLLTGIVSFFICLLAILAQVAAIGSIGLYLLNIPASISIICFGGLVVLYSVWGGMRSVSYTDVIQAIAALIVFSWVAQAIVQKAGGAEVLFRNLSIAYPQKLTFFGHPKLFYKIKSAIFWDLSLAWILSPPIIQRMLVTQEKRKIRSTWCIIAFLYFIFLCAIVLIGLGAVMIKVDFDPTDKSKGLLLHLIKNLFQHQAWVQDLMFVGILGILLSTMDSFLHSIGVVLVRDVIEPFRAYMGRGSLQKKSFYSRLCIFFVGFLSIVVGSMRGASLLSRGLYAYSVQISALAIIPLLIGIIGFKTDKVSWMNYCVSYIIITGALKWLKWHEYDTFLFAVPLSTLAYFITHIYINGGIVILKRSEQTVAEQLWLPTWQGTMKYFKSWLLSPLQLHILAGRKIVNSPTQSLPFSMLIFALYTFSSVMTGAKADMGLANFMAGVHVIGITLCCGLMLEGIWPDKLKPYFALYWFAILFYCLPLGGTLAFLRAHEGAVSSILWVSSFAVLAFLVDSNTFCLLSMLGAGLSTIIWRLIVGSLPNDLWNDSSLTGTGILVLMVISILLFSRSREQYSSQRLNWNRTASSILGHDLRNTANMLSGVASVINSTFKMSQPASNSEGKKGYWIEKQHGKFLEDYAQKLTKKSTETKREIKNFMDFMEQQVIGWLEQEKMSMHKTVKDVVASMKDKYANSMQITVSCTKDFEANVFSVFPNVIANLIKNASVHGQATKVTVKVDGVKRTLTVRDNGKGISADVLPRIFDLNFTTGDKGKKNAGVGLAFVKMVMNASSGKVSCHSRKGDEKSFTEFAMAFPQA